MEERPWGAFTKFVENTPCTVKIITVHPGQELSLQYHNHRDEFWFVISGSGVATIGDVEKGVKAGDTCFIEKKVNHRIKANDETLVFMEIALGKFDEDDIVRIEDDYGRTDENA
jgi:mannose-6-phosphate isomerase-like protein (cupin superfamily)